MNKCTKCGNEFEGNFCPYCGEKRSEISFCRNCGGKVDFGLQFCPTCGKPLNAEKTVTREKKEVSGGFKEKLYNLLKYVPAIVFSLFSVLLFVFYIAPVASVPFFGGMGSVYSFNEGILEAFPELKGEMISLIIFAVLALLCAVGSWVVLLSEKTKYKTVRIARIDVKFSLISEFVGYAFYLIFLLLGSIICGKVSAGGAGAGACPILILVFSIIFALIAVGSKVAKYLLNKFYPEYAEKEYERENAEFADYKSKLESVINEGAPVMPMDVEFPKVPKTAARILKAKAISKVLSVSFILASLTAFLLKFFGMDEPFNLINYILPLIIIVTVPFVVTFPAFFYRVKRMKTEKLYKKAFLIILTFLCIAAVIIFCSLLMLQYVLDLIYDNLDIHGMHANNFYLWISIFIAIYGIASFILSLSILLKMRKIKKRDKADGEFGEQLKMYDEQKKQYACRIREITEYKRKNKRYSHCVKAYEKLNR